MTVYTLESPGPNLALPGGSVIKFEAISPTTGLAIGGVTVTNISVYGYDAGETEPLVETGPFMLVPGPDETAV